MKNELGKCPRCSSEELEYGVLEVQDNMVYYPFICCECQINGKEWYSLEFEEYTTNNEEKEDEEDE